MENHDKYKQMYDMVMEYEKELHEKNQKRMSIGLKCILIIPLIFLCMLFWTGSSKIIFLILWIASMFGIAVYLIYVEYMDYNIRERLHRSEETKEEEVCAGADVENEVEGQ